MGGALEAGARLAFVAVEDETEARQTADQLRKAGLLVNVVDRPDLCDFTTPSILDRDPVLIAIGTDGRSAGLAKHLRLRMERLLPPSLGRLAEALFASRDDLRRRYPDGSDRRTALDAALREGGALDPFDPRSHELVADWMSASATPAPFPNSTIPLSSGDPEDLTLRQARLLGEAETLLFEDGVPATILDRARADAVRRCVTREDGAELLDTLPAALLLLAPPS